MVVPKTKIKYRNRLWQARQEVGLKQKQIRLLLGHLNESLLSDYEQGIRLPPLEVALMLEIIYGKPLRILYSQLVTELEQQIREHIQKNPIVYKNLIGDNGELKEYCTYIRGLDNPYHSQVDNDKVRRHIITTMRRLHHL